MRAECQGAADNRQCRPRMVTARLWGRGQGREQAQDPRRELWPGALVPRGRRPGVNTPPSRPFLPSSKAMQGLLGYTRQPPRPGGVQEAETRPWAQRRCWHRAAWMFLDVWPWTQGPALRLGQVVDNRLHSDPGSDAFVVESTEQGLGQSRLLGILCLPGPLLGFHGVEASGTPISKQGWSQRRDAHLEIQHSGD